MMEQPEPLISVVRQKVLAAFQTMGVGEGACTEAVIIKEGHFVGRRFCLGGFVAVWMAGESHFSIFSKAGELIDNQPLENDGEATLKKAA